MNLPLFDLVTLVEGFALACNSDRDARRSLRTGALQAYSRERNTNTRATAAQYDQALGLFYWREYAWAAAQVAQGNPRIEVHEQQLRYGMLLAEQAPAVF